MIKTILRFLYFRYKNFFEELLIEDFYSMIPKDISEPAVDFLINGKQRLEPFLTVQAYNMQRRSIMDNKNSAQYHGILIHIRSLLVLLQKGGKPVVEVEKKEKTEDPIDGVQEFLSRGKARITN